MQQAQMQKKQLTCARSKDHPCKVETLSSEQISSQTALRNRHTKKLPIILPTEKSVERHPKTVSIKNIVGSKPGESLILSQIRIVNQNVKLSSRCRTTIKVTNAKNVASHPLNYLGKNPLKFKLTNPNPSHKIHHPIRKQTSCPETILNHPSS